MTPGDWPVIYERKLRFSDIDSQKIAFNGNYLVYFDDAVTDYVEALGLTWDELVDRGCDLVLVHAEIDFRSPGRIGDVLATGIRIGSVRSTSICFEFRTWVKRSGVVVAEGSEVLVSVSSSLEKIRVPEWFLTAVEDLQGPVARD